LSCWSSWWIRFRCRQLPKRGRGHPKVYSDRLFLKALVIMTVRHLHKVHELLSALEQPTPEMQTLRALLTENGRYPSRRTWERRLKAMPSTLPAQIGCFGRALVDLVQPWARCGRAAAIDSTVLRANGGVWHNKHREQGVVRTPRLIPRLIGPSPAGMAGSMAGNCTLSRW
jgi:hypothetical protein